MYYNMGREREREKIEGFGPMGTWVNAYTHVSDVLNLHTHTHTPSHTRNKTYELAFLAIATHHTNPHTHKSMQKEKKIISDKELISQKERKNPIRDCTKQYIIYFTICTALIIHFFTLY